MIIRQAKVEDYSNLYHFLTKNYKCGSYLNWDVGRLTFCRYAVNNGITFPGEEDWFSHIKVWEQDGEIVAFWHNEEQEQYFMQVSKAYKYLETEILEDILADVKARFPEKEKIELTACAEDYERIQLLESYSAVKLDFEDERRRLVLSEEKAEHIEKSYRVVRVDKEDTILCEKLAQTYQYVWPESSYVPNGKVVSNMLADESGDIMAWAVLNEEEKCVAYTMGFIDSVKEYAYLYPVAVRQEYLEEGALEILLDRVKNDLFHKKIQYVVINAWYKERENVIFAKKGAKEWKKEYIFQLQVKP